MKKIVSAVLAAALALSLAACGSSTSTSTAAPAADAQSAPAAAEAGETIKIGVLGPRTGAVSQYGIAVMNGAELYIKKVNEAGGINGKQIEIVEMDEQGDATQAVNCFTQMVDQGITALIGDVTTGPTLAVVAEAEALNMPMVTASATAAAVTYDEETKSVHTNVFRSTFTDPFQGTKMADFVTEILGGTKVGILYNKDGDYESGQAAAFAASFVGEVVANESFSDGDVDFSAQLDTIIAAGADTLYLPNYYEVNGMILTQARAKGLNVPTIGGDGWDGIHEYASAEDLKDCYFCNNYAAGASEEFEAGYEAEYGEKYPNGFAPLGYDAALITLYGIQAAEDAGLAAGTDEYKQAVIDAIKGGTIEGITGTFTFDDHNDPVKSTQIVTFEGGAYKLWGQY